MAPPPWIQRAGSRLMPRRQEKPLAKQFLQYLMDPKRLEQNFSATLTVNIPPVKASEHLQWERDPKTAMLKDYASTAHMIGCVPPFTHVVAQACEDLAL